MNKVTIWQCKDSCCENKPHSLRYWLARSKDFNFYEMTPSWTRAISMTDCYVWRRTK